MFDRARLTTITAAVAATVLLGVGLRSASATISGGQRADFVPITPCRLFDTRPATQVGPRGTPLGNGETYTQPVVGANGNCTIPAAATAIAMNVTTVDGAPNVVGQYTVFLVRDALAATAQSSSAIAAAVLGGGQTNVIVTI